MICNALLWSIRPQNSLLLPVIFVSRYFFDRRRTILATLKCDCWWCGLWFAACWASVEICTCDLAHPHNVASTIGRWHMLPRDLCEHWLRVTIVIVRFVSLICGRLFLNQWRCSSDVICEVLLVIHQYLCVHLLYCSSSSVDYSRHLSLSPVWCVN